MARRDAAEPGRLTVDVGCGEGRLGRVLVGSGHRVVGFDANDGSPYVNFVHLRGRLLGGGPASS